MNFILGSQHKDDPPTSEAQNGCHSNDGCRANAKMKDIAFPMTNPTTLLGKVAGKKWVSSVDMRQSFFQIEREESSEKFTAFWAGNSSYEFNRSAMGLKTSPSILQKLITKVLRGTEGSTASLLDDVG